MKDLLKEQHSGKTRIAVLGGGCGAMSAVWGLLQSEHADEYEITIYQMGWRLGGKGASGRNAKRGERIEEHGLHIWGGSYENGFRIMRQVYEAVGRDETQPLSTWYDPKHPERSAFLPHNYVSLPEFFDGHWQPWNLVVPLKSGLPGDGKSTLNFSNAVSEILQLMIEGLAGPNILWLLQSIIHTLPVDFISRLLDPFMEAAVEVIENNEWLDKQCGRISRWLQREALKALQEALQGASKLVGLLGSEKEAVYAEVLAPLGKFMDIIEGLFGGLLGRFPELRRFYVLVNFGWALINGLLSDDILHKGVDSVDHLEFTDWLAKHGASSITIGSSVVRGWHDYFFATRSGDAALPSMAASVALRTLFRFILTYKNSLFWRMQAGMGDVVFGPMYEVFKKRGVRFAFFHKVESLGVLCDGLPTQGIETIRIARQIDLKKGLTPFDYDPLVDVKGLPSWPSTPCYEQIDPSQAHKLQAENINLESSWADWEPVEMLELKRGKDFDKVILGIPAAALPALTKELTVQRPAWGEMLANLHTVQTIGVQLWFKKDQMQMGWRNPPTVGTVYANPLNTWANMDQLLPREDWSGEPPKSLVYLTGTITDDPPCPPPSSDHDYPQRQRDRVKAVTLTWLRDNFAPLWPRASITGLPDIDWSVLSTTTPGLEGEGRFDDQYWRANIDATERYVLSLPGGAKYRIRSDESGFDNLYLAGDWLATGLNAGCVEAAVMGGLQASQAISGYPQEIAWDTGDPFGPR